MDASDYQKYEDKMDKTLATLESAFATVRAGRASAAVLEHIRVDYYGQPTPITQIGTVAVPDPRTITITPWDAKTLKDVEKAILASDLGINPQNDGKLLRINFPQLTEERRRELAKQIAKYAEEAKVSVRNVRRDALDDFKAAKKKAEITEDDLKDAERDLQKLTEKFVKLIENAEEKKSKELLSL
ncbi:MAG: ribosome recycling factor [Oscillospiraceae bacterium]|jgi:ribosome recycling factor|nr:ribosome recycling factor [Oscillospiraceae bacterium]